MQINTQFNIGDLVYFILDNQIYRRAVRLITVEVRRNILNAEKPFEPLITYQFDATPSRGGMEVYKYENEVAATKEGLVNKISVDEPTEITGTGQGV